MAHSDQKFNAMGPPTLSQASLNSSFLKKVISSVFIFIELSPFTLSISCFIAEKALTILQSRHIPELSPPVPLALSPYPPTDPPTPLPPPAALPRLIKQLPQEFTDSQLYDLFRPFGALASAYIQTQFGSDAGIVEFWNEEDAIQAEQAMHCAEVKGQNIAVQVYQPRRTTSNVEFNVAAPTFVPSGLVYPSYPSPVR